MSAAPHFKNCSQCERVLPTSAFGKNRQAPDGLNYYCRECARRRQAEWVKKNPAKARAIKKRYLAHVHATNALRDT